MNNNEPNREQWVANQLAQLPPGLTILDVGCGKQPYRQYCSHLRYYSHDFSQYRPSSSDPGYHPSEFDLPTPDIICDITDLVGNVRDYTLLSGDRLDAVLCTEVLEHLPDPITGVFNIGQVLKPGGRLILTAPFTSVTHFAPYHYCTGFNRYWYEHHLPRYGLRIDQLVPNGDHFQLLAQELRNIKVPASMYAADEVSFYENFAVQSVLAMLDRFSQRNRLRSRGPYADELSCYGLHVLATKL